MEYRNKDLLLKHTEEENNKKKLENFQFTYLIDPNYDSKYEELKLNKVNSEKQFKKRLYENPFQIKVSEKKFNAKKLIEEYEGDQNVGEKMAKTHFKGVQVFLQKLASKSIFYLFFLNLLL